MLEPVLVMLGPARAPQIVLWKCKLDKPFPPQAAFDHGVLSHKQIHYRLFIFSLANFFLLRLCPANATPPGYVFNTGFMTEGREGYRLHTHLWKELETGGKLT